MTGTSGRGACTCHQQHGGTCSTILNPKKIFGETSAAGGLTIALIGEGSAVHSRAAANDSPPHLLNCKFAITSRVAAVCFSCTRSTQCAPWTRKVRNEAVCQTPITTSKQFHRLQRFQSAASASNSASAASVNAAASAVAASAVDRSSYGWCPRECMRWAGSR